MQIALASPGWFRPVLIGLILGMQIISVMVTVPVHASPCYNAPSCFNTWNLSSDPTSSGFPHIAASANNVYVVWLNNTSGNEDILFKASNNNGSSFRNPLKVSSTPTIGSQFPAQTVQLAAAGTYAYVVWQGNVSATTNDIFFRAISNNGTVLGSVIDVSSGVTGITDSESPQVGAVGNNVYVVWRATVSCHSPPCYDIFFKASTSHGSDLNTVIATTISTNADNIATPQVAAISNFVYVTWSELTSCKAPCHLVQTYLKFSSDSGTTFTSAGNNGSLSSTAISGKTEQDVYQNILAAGNNVYVAWTNDTAFPPAVSNITADNTMFAASTANGQSFNSAANLHKGLVIDLYPQMAASGNNVYVAWGDTNGTVNQVLYRVSNNKGATNSFAPIRSLSGSTVSSKQPVIAASGSNVFVSWVQTDSSNDVYFTSSNDNGVTFLPNAFDLSPTVGNSVPSPSPAIAAAGTNVYLTWQDDSPGNDDILFRGTGAPPSVPDVAVSAIALSKSFAYSGVSANPVIVNVTASNPGTVSETFYVSAKANAILIGNQSVTLAAGTSVIVTFSWNTASLARGTYVLTAHASQVAGETNLSNNDMTWSGTFTSRLKGDVNNDCKVDIVDLSSVGAAFGKTIGAAGFNPAADLNNDGKIDITDLTSVGGTFGQAC